MNLSRDSQLHLFDAGINPAPPISYKETAPATAQPPNPSLIFDAGNRGVELRAPHPLETEFLTGSAGTGKTYEVRQRKASDPEGVVLAATTGIAAVNLGTDVTTINSLLGFFDQSSLLEAYRSGKLQYRIRKLANEGLKELIVDEISTLSAPHLDLLYDAYSDVSREYGGFKLTLVGDFCQLPPIPDKDSPETGKYAFEAECWSPYFSNSTTRLSRIWRQDDEQYVRALQAARRGDGEEALHYLQVCGVRFEPRIDDNFEGTTIRATNFAVDDYNDKRLRQLPGDNSRVPTLPSSRWSFKGDDKGWDSIPDRFQFKPGAYVMILANGPSFEFVNGDCGTVVGTEGSQIIVRLKRNNKDVRIGYISRERKTRTRPSVTENEVLVIGTAEYDEMVRTNGEPLQRVVKTSGPRPEWITGWITYVPLRLAYATTVHKSQGLSLDTIQLDLSSSFLAKPAMMYVALSRCRTPKGLVLVGKPEQVVANTKIDPKVVQWL